jgi:hypothetical protein
MKSVLILFALCAVCFIMYATLVLNTKVQTFEHTKQQFVAELNKLPLDERLRITSMLYREQEAEADRQLEASLNQLNKVMHVVGLPDKRGQEILTKYLSISTTNPSSQPTTEPSLSNFH